MNVTLSLYLDVIRFLAAIGVFMAHLSSSPFTSETLWWRFGSYGAVCVMVFFVLSGYVIAFVVSEREGGCEYFVSRFSRLYSVVIPALFITFFLDYIGMRINPDFYSNQAVMWKPESWTGYISSVLFLNEYQIFGFGGVAPGSNGPFWSLSFEATYYLLAGVGLFLPWRFSIPFAIVVIFAAGKTIAALFPIWLLGCLIYHARQVSWFGGWKASILMIFSAVLIVGVPVFSWVFPDGNLGYYFPWGRGLFNRNLFFDYFVAIFFGLHLFSSKNLFLTIEFDLEKFLKIVRWGGRVTFPLYCIHYPVLCFFRSVSPWPEKGWANAAFLFIGVILVVALVAPICEVLKNFIRKKISVCLVWILG